jgi:hypothetical protein
MSSKKPLSDKYPLVSNADLPKQYMLVRIYHKYEEITKLGTLFVQRILVANYKLLPHIENRESLVARLQGASIQLCLEWSIFVRTPAQEMILVRYCIPSKYDPKYDPEPGIGFYHVCGGEIPEDGPGELWRFEDPDEFPVDAKQMKEGQIFVEDFLAEAHRLKRLKPNPKRDVEELRYFHMIHVDNVFFSNLQCADAMLEYAEQHESKMHDQFAQYGASGDYRNPDFIKSYNLFGMFHLSSMTYLFIALEGLVNLLYFVFLKPELVKEYNNENFYERQDIYTKVLMLPSVCRGFKQGQGPKCTRELKRLKNYRNAIFHSKITDSLKMINYAEPFDFDDGKLYLHVYDFEEHHGELPLAKRLLTQEKVLKFKADLMAIIADILQMMEDQTRELVENHVIEPCTAQIMIIKDKEGNLTLAPIPDDWRKDHL